MFAGDPDDCCGGSAPVGPTMATGLLWMMSVVITYGGGEEATKWL